MRESLSRHTFDAGRGVQSNMTTFDEEFFRRSQERWIALQKTLSRQAHEGLAREVVRQLAQRASEVETTDPEYPEADIIETLCRALVNTDAEKARTMMLHLQRDGLTLDVLYARYLAPAAGTLGKWWDDDEISFVGVTLGVARIFDLVRLLRDQLPAPRITRSVPVLFAAVPGENHGVGVEMAAELFRQHGWDTRLLVGADHADILSEIRTISCLVLGLSSGGRRTADALARIVHAVRVAHPEIYILVSGHVVVSEPELIAAISPDSAVASVEDALATMEALSGEPIALR